MIDSKTFGAEGSWPDSSSFFFLWRANACNISASSIYRHNVFKLISLICGKSFPPENCSWKCHYNSNYSLTPYWIKHSQFNKITAVAKNSAQCSRCNRQHLKYKTYRVQFNTVCCLLCLPYTQKYGAKETSQLVKSISQVYRNLSFQSLSLSRPIFPEVSVEIKIIYYWKLTQCKKVHGPLHYEEGLCTSAVLVLPHRGLCVSCVFYSLYL